jgi:hypothetical protein
LVNRIFGDMPVNGRQRIQHELPRCRPLKVKNSFTS